MHFWSKNKCDCLRPRGWEKDSKKPTWAGTATRTQLSDFSSRSGQRWPLKSPIRGIDSFEYLRHLEALTSTLTLPVTLSCAFIHPTFLLTPPWRGHKHHLRLKKGGGEDWKKRNQHAPSTNAGFLLWNKTQFGKGKKKLYLIRVQSFIV